MSWNFNKDKNKDQPRKKGAKGMYIEYITIYLYYNIIIYIAWEDDEVKAKPKFIKNTQNSPNNPSNTNNFTNQNNENDKKSAYEKAYHDYNKKNNLYNNPISKNDIYNNPNLYKNSNM